MTAPAAAERVLCRTRLYRPTRNAYQRILNREHMAERRAGRAFYRQFVPPGSVVFDAGANHGHMTEMFLELGARVVAIEPNPQLAATIRRRYGGRRLKVEQCAIGREPGTATLHIGDNDLYSSISDEWVSRVREHPDLPDRWTDAVPTAVRTLDDLIDQHGDPAFVKIDIEGFEDQALGGLSRPVQALSFEYQCPALDMTERCLRRLEDLGRFEYQVAAGETLRFMAPAWASSDEVLAFLADLREREPITHGDIYARLSAG